MSFFGSVVVSFTFRLEYDRSEVHDGHYPAMFNGKIMSFTLSSVHLIAAATNISAGVFYGSFCNT